ncbi:MAG: hypothetical protein ACREIA_03245 [Opitutaceae bacterium]
MSATTIHSRLDRRIGAWGIRVACLALALWSSTAAAEPLLLFEIFVIRCSAVC